MSLHTHNTFYLALIPKHGFYYEFWRRFVVWICTTDAPIYHPMYGILTIRHLFGVSQLRTTRGGVSLEPILSVSKWAQSPYWRTFAYLNCPARLHCPNERRLSCRGFRVCSRRFNIWSVITFRGSPRNPLSINHVFAWSGRHTNDASLPVLRQVATALQCVACATEYSHIPNSRVKARSECQ